MFATNSYPFYSPPTTTYSAVALNSALPTHDNEIEIGGTLMPSDRFLLNAWFGIDIQSQNIGEAIVQNQPANDHGYTILMFPMGFSSQSFPFGINGSYRATDKLTLNGGAAYYTNFIDQDVAFGAGADHTFRARSRTDCSRTSGATRAAPASSLWAARMTSPASCV